MIKKILYLVILIFVFSYGIGVGHYKIFPYKQVKSLKQPVNTVILNFMPDKAPEDRRLNNVFSKELPRIPEFLNSPIETLKEVRLKIEELEVVKNSDFFEVYNHLYVEEPKEKTDSIAELSYKVDEDDFKAYAYYIDKKNNNHDCALLIIPGSGDNQAYEIYNETGYHGDIRSTLSEYCTLYILIKPNQGYKSIHNGQYRLNDEMFLYSSLLLEGYSYSATYLTESLAWLKHIQENYKLGGVAGLSQGGKASFLVSLQTEPDFTIVSSCFSLHQRDLTVSNSDQIVIPDLYNYYTIDKIKEIVANQKTKYFLSFSEGMEESPICHMETETNYTCSFLKETSPYNFFCIYHKKGHSFPKEEIMSWIEQEILN